MGNESAYSNEVSATPINTPPVITSAATAAATEDIRFVYLATGTDTGGTALTYAYDLMPSWTVTTALSLAVYVAESRISRCYKLTLRQYCAIMHAIAFL